MAKICDDYIHLDLNLANSAIFFQSLEFEDRGSETQLQMTKKLNVLVQSSSG